jgi:septal ring factor EnvC (AmiA/AmiB activator)
MNFLKSVPKSIYIVLLAVIVGLFVANFGSCSSVKKDNKIIDKQIEALNKDFKKEQLKLDSLNKKVILLETASDVFKDSLIILNYQLQENKTSYLKLNKKYEAIIKNINNFNSNDISSFFTDRYGK